VPATIPRAGLRLPTAHLAMEPNPKVIDWSARPATVTASGMEAQQVFEAAKSGICRIDAAEIGRTSSEWIFELSYPNHQRQPDLI
jgi:hypothetical protein